MFDNTYGSIFHFFFSLIISLRMSDRFETYGSAEIRTIFMNDEEGKLIKSDSLFETCTISGVIFICHTKFYLFSTTLKWHSLEKQLGENG